MISFKPVNLENKDEVLGSVFSDEDVRRFAAALLCCFDFSDEDTEYAVSESDGCVLVRIFDMGRYMFLFPQKAKDNARIDAALDALTRYAVKEELPLVLTGVTAGELCYLAPYRHFDVDAEDIEGESHRVRIKRECELLEEIPEYVGERVTLNALTEVDKARYGALCRDEENNKYWGYDYRCDCPDADDDYFFDMQEREFNTGAAITFAVRCDLELVGALDLYGFDGKGRAQIDVRIFPEHQRRGLASEALECAFEISRSLGLSTLTARVMKENLPSRRLCERLCDVECERESTVEFLFKLFE